MMGVLVAIASGVIYQRTAPQQCRSNHDKIDPMSENENAPYAPSASATSTQHPHNATSATPTGTGDKPFSLEAVKKVRTLHLAQAKAAGEKFSAFTHEEILSTVTEALTRSSAELQAQAQRCLEQFQCDALAADKRDSGTSPLVYWTPALTQDTVFLFHAERHGWRWGWRKSLVRGDYSPLRALY